MMTLNISKEEAISEEIFKRLASVALVDKYSAFQTLDDEWTKTAVDLEILQTEGFEAAKKAAPNMVLKKKDGKDHEVQDGYIGHVIPFGLVQATLLRDETAALRKKEERLSEITSSYEKMFPKMARTNLRFVLVGLLTLGNSGSLILCLTRYPQHAFKGGAEL